MVSITKEQVAEIVARTKEGIARYRIAEDMGLPPERVAVVQSARGLRSDNPARVERDNVTVRRWLAAGRKTGES